jgi:predicted aspartyl protease
MQCPDVPFKLLGEHQVLVPVSVDGLSQADFILDTGSQHTLVDSRITSKLGLAAVARVSLRTVTGTATASAVRLNVLQVGTALVSGVEALSLDLRECYGLHPSIHGILGQDFLRQFSYLLDYAEQRLVFDIGCNLSGSLKGYRLEVEDLDSRDSIAATPATSAHKPVRFLIDSGSPFAVVFSDRLRNSGLHVAREALQVTIRTGSGSRRIEFGRIRAINIGGVRLYDLAVGLTPESDGETRLEDGLLPTRLFQRIYISHGGKSAFVMLNPRLIRGKRLEPALAGLPR